MESMFWRFKMYELVNKDVSKFPKILNMTLFDFVDALRILEKYNRVEYLQMTKSNSLI